MTVNRGQIALVASWWALAVFIIGAAFGAWLVGAVQEGYLYQGHVYPLCATEDSDNCVWLASLQGNGTGFDLVTIDGTTYFMD